MPEDKPPVGDDYHVSELMVCRLAAELDESGVTVLGSFTPLAYAAYMLAKLTHARDAFMVGYNALGMPAVELSFMSAEAAAYKGAVAHWGFIPTVNIVHLAKRGNIECVSSAQFDPTGAINLSVIGPYDDPKVRLPGGVGAPEVIQNYRKMLVYFGRHDRRTLVQEVDFATGRRTPIADEERSARGLLTGPIIVVTSLAVLVKDGPDPFRIESLHPGVAAEDVVERTGFELTVPSSIPVTPEPTAEQLSLLRQRIDPQGTIQFDFLKGDERRSYLRDVLSKEWERARAIAVDAKDPR